MTNQIWFHKYQIIKVLGHGGTADVFLCLHTKLNTLRAIKRIRKDHILHSQLLNEAHILKNLCHSCIPTIFDFEEDAEYSYIIEEYIEGRSLKVLRNQSEHIPEKTIIEFTIQLCDLLQYLYSTHNPVLHLDLKPDNIIISENQVKLIDFGASSYKNETGKRKYSLGTKGFAAPELYSGHTPDERTDVYGIGTLIYFMVTGKSYNVTEQKRSVKNRLRNCSAPLQGIMKQCLQYYPMLRYSCVFALKKKLLDLHQKNVKVKDESRKSITIAIAGSQERIGTTHLGFLIVNYYSQKSMKALYMEKNNSDHVSSILNRYKQNKIKDGAYIVHNCYMLPGCRVPLPAQLEAYPVKILDYGKLNQDNYEDFLNSDIPLLVCGGKEWELEETEKALKLVCEKKSVRYLFNFVDGSRFREILKYMGKLTCSRIPYEPDPFVGQIGKTLSQFLDQLIE
ncbi:hypothetical protein GCM10023142_10320 [Anaerocolumna aminovalerica]|jgi:serine/threonine protein kinase|uniref:Serine/threonine protein kinase n=1 Tax=Anaerocolumna aminovalerica TaxID=1527 RepID=A0A1I5I2Y3_9FIRM|nr:protein kinase [Anaerocolumna aminovalerica]MBU5333765.1 protein kinase [Anaerocolumna aminovalerica]MDU6265268.1 protein kinase [Anaerocolumna aminovalerica]SFO54540.1 serine/threonine protein kinase [Anaerocolumna aminovalerica]